ncbi:MAG TPA: hypothetical protein VFU31_24575 [Candidatus Binatia bacterium]|nr:hypothetical protein [Candidatus Binatia bacterium]
MNKLNPPRLPSTREASYADTLRLRLNDILTKLILNNNQVVDGRMFQDSKPASFPYTLNQNDQVVFVDQSASSQSVVLMDAREHRYKRPIVKAIGLSANQIEISALSGNVEGRASFTISGTFAVAQFQSDGTNWWRL